MAKQKPTKKPREDISRQYFPKTTRELDIDLGLDQRRPFEGSGSRCLAQLAKFKTVPEPEFAINKALAYLRGIELAFEAENAIQLAKNLRTSFTTPKLVLAAQDGAQLACERGYTNISARGLYSAELLITIP